MPIGRGFAAFLLVLFLAPGAARAGHRPVTLRMPAFDVPARSNREVCTFIPVPVRHAMDIGEVVILNSGGNAEFSTHHMILYHYKDSLDPLAALAGQTIDDTACLNFGPGNPSALQIVATSQAIRSRQPMPRRTALHLEPGTMGGHKVIGLVLNSHWINGSDQTQRAHVRLKLVPARQVVKPLKPIFEVVANGFIKVPPGGKGDVGFKWAPGTPSFGAYLGGAENPTGPACVTMLIGHMHRRGTLFTASFDDGGGGAPREIYRDTQYSDPPALDRHEDPILVKPGQSIWYHCWHDNATDPRLGCEEQAGVVPGRSVLEAGLEFETAAAKLCRTKGSSPAECPPTDPKYPGHTFTGNCVEANLVFGFTSEDDMCILPGYYYDANAAAAPGQECDL